MPRNVDFPTEDYLRDLAASGGLEGHVLERLRYTQYRDSTGMNGLLMAFRDGEDSPAALVADWGTHLSERSYRIDRPIARKTVKFVSMRMKNSATYTGLRIYWERGRTALAIDEEVWSDEDEGAWTAPQQVPDGQVIIGYRCDTVSSPSFIRQLSFVLGVEGQPEIAGEIRFPSLATYPSFDEFSELYLAGDFRLAAINYKHFLNQFDLSAI